MTLLIRINIYRRSAQSADPADVYRNSNFYKNRIFDKIRFLTWYGPVLRPDSYRAQKTTQIRTLKSWFGQNLKNRKNFEVKFLVFGPGAYRKSFSRPPANAELNFSMMVFYSSIFIEKNDHWCRYTVFLGEIWQCTTSRTPQEPLVTCAPKAKKGGLSYCLFVIGY